MLQAFMFGLIVGCTNRALEHDQNVLPTAKGKVSFFEKEGVVNKTGKFGIRFESLYYA